jgi:hypothetical protein
MAKVLFPGTAAGVALLPIMIFHQAQLMACAWIANHYARNSNNDFLNGRRRVVNAWWCPLQSAGSALLVPDPEPEMLARLNKDSVFMMGDNPMLTRMPAKPKLIDFFRARFSDITVRHLTVSAMRALEQGQDERVVLAVLLHDISNGCFIRSDHGYWGGQMIAPYVDEEIAWAVRYHQALRCARS